MTASGVKIQSGDPLSKARTLLGLFRSVFQSITQGLPCLARHGFPVGGRTVRPLPWVWCHIWPCQMVLGTILARRSGSLNAVSNLPAYIYGVFHFPPLRAEPTQGLVKSVGLGIREVWILVLSNLGKLFHLHKPQFI